MTTKESSHSLTVPSSTLLLDPQACLDDWKEQIKIKKSIPAHQQRLTFNIRDLSKSTLASPLWAGDCKKQIEAGAPEQLFKDLQGWHAILYIEDSSTKLIDPLVFSEGDELAHGLTSRTAEELRQLGVPCKVFYLSFDKLGDFPDSVEFRELKDICIKVDRDLQDKALLICLNGRVNGNDLPYPLRYHMHGRELSAKLSILEQTVEYRKLQRMRHHMLMSSRDDLGVIDSPSLLRTGGSSDEAQASRCLFHEDYFIHFERNHDFTAIITRESRLLRCIVLTLITIPMESVRHAEHPTSDPSRVLSEQNPHSGSFVPLSQDTSMLSFCEALPSPCTPSHITNLAIEESLDVKPINSMTHSVRSVEKSLTAMKNKKKKKRKRCKKKLNLHMNTASGGGNLNEKDEVKGKRVEESFDDEQIVKDEYLDTQSSIVLGEEFDLLLNGSSKSDLVYHQESSEGALDTLVISGSKKPELGSSTEPILYSTIDTYKDCDGVDILLNGSSKLDLVCDRESSKGGSDAMVMLNSKKFELGSSTRLISYLTTDTYTDCDGVLCSSTSRLTDPSIEANLFQSKVVNGSSSGLLKQVAKKGAEIGCVSCHCRALLEERGCKCTLKEAEISIETGTEISKALKQLPQDMLTLSCEENVSSGEDQAMCSSRSLYFFGKAGRERNGSCGKEVVTMGCEDEKLSEGLKWVTRNILDAVHDSYDSKVIYDKVKQCSFGYYFSEFDKFLKASSPVLHILPCNQHRDGDYEYSCVCLEGMHCCFACATGETLTGTSVSHIWQWYLEPSCFGLEVKTTEQGKSDIKDTTHCQFQAFFVPYLSGLQFFGYKQKQTYSANSRNSSSSWFSRNAPILSTLLPKQVTYEDSDMDNVATTQISSSGDKMEASARNGWASRTCRCLHTGEESNASLLFEFYEGERPHNRKPLFDRLEELASGNVDPSSHMVGDATLLKSAKLGDLHPASWFSVAWYPIYRIPDASFRAAFLTYHSLSHFICEPSTEIICEKGCSEPMRVIFPVVGLASYNAQAEYWFALPPQGEIAGSPNVGEINCLPDAFQHRLSRLDKAAAVMAGANETNSHSNSWKHLDYTFFSSRNR